MANCSKCGLVVLSSTGIRCYLTDRPVPQSSGASWDCYLFSKIIVEDGLPLSPEQHYLIRKSELDGKK